MANKPPLKDKPFKACKVCLSPYREHIEGAWRDTKPVARDQYLKAALRKKYGEHFKIRTAKAFNRMLRKHFSTQHQKQARKLINLNQPIDSPQPKNNVSLKELSQSLLDIGAQMADHYKDNPLDAVNNLNFRDIMSAQDTITKRMMVQVNKDAVKLQMAKLFSGQMPKQFKFQDGELVDEDGSKSLVRILAENKD